MNKSVDGHNNLNHVAIIMDGNGRWANERSHQRIWGHIRGSKIVSEIVQMASDLRLKALTLYAFSTENWCRPKDEVKLLFKLLYKFLNLERERIIKNNVRFKVMGDLTGLPKETVELIEKLEDETKNNLGLKLTFAFGYGGRSEIVHAVNRFIKSNPDKLISEVDIAQNLYVTDIEDVDLLIRTGGDQRISNFLLWQIAYSELYFTKTKWPEFTSLEFREIIEQCSKRERRFGDVKPSVNLEQNSLKAQLNKGLLKD